MLASIETVRTTPPHDCNATAPHTHTHTHTHTQMHIIIMHTYTGAGCVDCLREGPGEAAWRSTDIPTSQALIHLSRLTTANLRRQKGEGSPGDPADHTEPPAEDGGQESRWTASSTASITMATSHHPRRPRLLLQRIHERYMYAML